MITVKVADQNPQKLPLIFPTGLVRNVSILQVLQVRLDITLQNYLF